MYLSACCGVIGLECCPVLGLYNSALWVAVCFFSEEAQPIFGGGIEKISRGRFEEQDTDLPLLSKQCCPICPSTLLSLQCGSMTLE